MDRTTAYAKKVVEGKILKGRTEYLCCKRHLNDMNRKGFEYIFDVDLAEKAINIANELTIAEGEEPKRLKTRGFQDFIIGSLHGWRKKRSDKLRFREGYIQVGRQNGKSFLCGTECNNWSTFSGYNRGRIFIGATKQDQANIVWDEVDKFISSDKDLDEIYHIRRHERTITSKVTGTFIKSVGRDTKSLDGFRSILAIVDEYHAHPNNQMYKLLHDGQVKVKNALTLAITTAGFNITGPCYEQYEFSKKILEGVVDKESLFIFICEMDKDDDIWDYRNWAKSNPLLLWTEEDTYDMAMVKIFSEKAIDAQEKGGEDLFNFLTKSLNKWVMYSGAKFIDMEAFKECESDFTLEEMRGKECYLGIDLSSGGDLTSIALVFPLENERYYIYSHSYLPALRLEEHERTDDVPYRIWADQGLLTLTEGAFGLKTDYNYILQHIKEIIERYGIRFIGCGYDPHNANIFVPELEFLKCELVEIVQSARSLNDPTIDLRLAVEAKQILYDKNNALMKWSFANAVTTSNSFGEIKVEKNQNMVKNRIDVVDAVIDAWKLIFINKGLIQYDADDDFDEWITIMNGGDRD